MTISTPLILNHGFFFKLHQNRKQVNLLQHFLKWTHVVKVLPQFHRLIFLIPSRELFFFFFFFFFICIAMTPKCSLRHYKRQISFPEAKVLLRHTALHSSVTSLAAQSEHAWTSFESELVEGCGLRVPGSHTGAASIQTLQWERNAFASVEPKDVLDGSDHALQPPPSSKQRKTQKSFFFVVTTADSML